MPSLTARCQQTNSTFLSSVPDIRKAMDLKDPWLPCMFYLDAKAAFSRWLMPVATVIMSTFRMLDIAGVRLPHLPERILFKCPAVAHGWVFCGFQVVVFDKPLDGAHADCRGDERACHELMVSAWRSALGIPPSGGRSHPQRYLGARASRHGQNVLWA